MADSRPGWDQYFLLIAKVVASRADCTRRQVGAVIAKNHRVVACGYNGAPAGEPDCLTAGACPRAFSGVPSGSGDYDHCIAIHAEAGAIMWSSWEQRQGATIYVTHEPCAGCRKLIRGSGILRAVWPGGTEEWQRRVSRP